MYLPGQLIIEHDTPVLGALGVVDKKIIALGIQAAPNTQFYINGYSDANATISVGNTGIYELDLTNGFGLITSIVFTERPAEGNRIILDYLYIENETGASTL